jgi:hypothetical protein
MKHLKEESLLYILEHDTHYVIICTQILDSKTKQVTVQYRHIQIIPELPATVTSCFSKLLEIMPEEYLDTGHNT